MSAITRLAKSDTTSRTQTSATLTEVPSWSVTWSDLTTAGFVNGDVVVVLCRITIGGSAVNATLRGQMQHGTSLDSGGAGKVVESEWTIEPEDTSSIRGHHHAFVSKITLVTNQGFYFGIAGDGTNDSRNNDFSILILKLGDLPADAWRFAEQTHSGDAPTAYDTSGASVTVPGLASGNDWLLFANSSWLIDSTTADILMALSWSGTDYGEVHEEGEDVAEIRSYLTSRYVTGVTGDTTLRARYRVDTSTTHDCVRTAVFALRLSAFRDHDGVQATTVITHSVLDTYQECAGLPTYVHGGGDLIVVAQSRTAAVGEATKSMYGQLQIGGVDMIAGLGRNGGAKPHGTLDQLPWTYLGMSTVSTGTLDIDMDIAEDSDISPTYDADYHVLAVFSAELAAGAAEPVHAFPRFTYIPEIDDGLR